MNGYEIGYKSTLQKKKLLEYQRAYAQGATDAVMGVNPENIGDTDEDNEKILQAILELNTKYDELQEAHNVLIEKFNAVVDVVNALGQRSVSQK